MSKYNAIGLKGFDTNNMDGVLCLGGGVSDDCPSGAEYEACPQTWILDHPSIGAADPVVEQQNFCTDPQARSMLHLVRDHQPHRRAVHGELRDADARSR